jgi:thioesterase domain-containing protein
MRAVQLFTEIERQLGRRLPIAALFRAPTFGQLVRLLRAEGCETRWPALVPIQPQGTRPPVIWLHTLGGGGGGGLLRYRALALLLGADQPSYGIEAPHEPFADIRTMAAAYIEMLQTLQPRGPYYLGGYCFAGNVAFEMACQLEARGETVALLAVLEAMPPEAMHRRQRITWRNLGAFARNAVWWGRDFVWRPPRLVMADLARLARKLARRAPARPDFRELGEVVDLEHYPPGFRHYAEVHYRAMQQYRPGVYGGRITLFRARTRPLLNFDPLLGWGPHAAGGITVQVVPGQHESFLEPPLVRVLAEQFRAALTAAQRADSGRRA